MGVKQQKQRGIVDRNGALLRRGYDLLIGTLMPNVQSADFETVSSIEAMKFVAAVKGYKVWPQTVGMAGCDIPLNRRGLVAEGTSAAINARWLLMVDMDTAAINPKMILSLIQHMEQGHRIVGTVCFGKKQPHFPMAGFIDLDTGLTDCMPDFEPDQGLMQVDWVGAGCLMIDLSVFAELEKASFEVFPGQTVPCAQLPLFHKSMGFNKVTKCYQEIGEDITFCLKCKSAGIKVFLDTGMLTGHRYHYDVGWRDYAQYRDSIGKLIADGKKPAELWSNRGPE